MIDQTSAPRRRTPAQDRSRATVEVICAAASALIEEGGIGALTTNAVAKRAGVSITAVYAYFPDKWSIVHELFDRLERLRADALIGFFEDFDTVEDWKAVIDAVWDRMARFRVEVPAGRALRKALYSHPRLAELDLEGSVRTTRLFAAAMLARRPALDPEQAYRASWAATICAGLLIDDAVRDGTIDWDRLTEGKLLVTSYIAVYLDGEP